MEQTAKILEVARSTVQIWIKAYRKRGVVAVLVQGPHRGRKPRLSLDQKRELATMIRQGPEECGFDTGVWTSPIIADLVKRRFKIVYSPSQILRLLHELGFSVQYPRQRLSKAIPVYDEFYSVQRQKTSFEAAQRIKKETVPEKLGVARAVRQK